MPFIIIVLIIVFLVVAVTVYFCIVLGARSDDHMKKMIHDQRMICLDCGKIFTMEQWEIRCCCPNPECHSYNVELCKNENEDGK